MNHRIAELRYEASCSVVCCCGWRSPYRGHMERAKREHREHVKQHKAA